MSVERSKDFRRLASAGLFVLTSMGWVGSAKAQDHTADPYKPYNQQYEQFVYPAYPSGYGLTPNQNLLERGGYGGANQFQRFLDSEEGPSDELGTGRRRSGPGIPYYSAYRQYDKDYGRIYQPNQESDKAFQQDQRSKHDKYIAYLKERDPRKRAELYRAYTRDANKVSRDLANPRGQAARATSPNTATPKTEDGAVAPTARRRSAAPASGTGAAPSTLSTKPAPRQRKPSDILRESDELDAGRLTAPGLAPRSGSSKPK
ncbi:hypothetical protein [Singulisphaera acidiphila]|uniref:Uncharacterized protein n=1 Tax=Singulisphaera acidiphila (strain ATCC BAA-1392 / DSM 18658 / VKM B-2454 / MOB10) TaxID=886293 RepID=L0DCJ4_SINAD|nr:hypothetical protein [Singulisphaera acidiphila]AGA26595.1 hypothetical protein Sinac_2277 [Singulisphaera acidiphila DSM 18658]